ncbi:upstream stimulatory factor 2 isoform X2 [Lingula anatina]|uniref:Upstream stimulatory factor 2 isoform X2 n=1 Tax=Lingula anatina TaxID=7574 RepID=A0A1S3JVP6_LINAN|nr:upstream stimulatory factor 2 isoform X2 [Lingula anatina]|eukprot:XP_013414131.1 upstream stimulatory factor 2 isoform X2 [Lingula anatina]
MDMLDHSLDPSSQDKPSEDSNEEAVQVHLTQGEEGEGEAGEDQGTAIIGSAGQQITLDPVQYQFRADGPQGQVTYRVVQVTGEDGQTAQVVTSGGFPAGTQVAQAVIQSPFSNGSSPTPESQPGETRFAYLPAVSGAGDTSQAELTTAATLGQVTTAGGQFYVMMSPQDVLQGQRTIAPRTAFAPKMEGARTGRDERRRATHNEVERRRRDKINNWIVTLSKLVPDCAQDHTKQGQVGEQSKGGILAKACDYINDLRTANERMAQTLKDAERLSVDHDLLQQQISELKQENALLRAQMQQHGLLSAELAASGT